jgi:hypothetical protein
VLTRRPESCDLVLGVYGSESSTSETRPSCPNELVERCTLHFPGTERLGDRERAIREVLLGRYNLDRDELPGERPKRKCRLETCNTCSGDEHTPTASAHDETSLSTAIVTAATRDSPARAPDSDRRRGARRLLVRRGSVNQNGVPTFSMP